MYFRKMALKYILLTARKRKEMEGGSVRVFFFFFFIMTLWGRVGVCLQREEHLDAVSERCVIAPTQSYWVLLKSTVFF